ncbi:hypothetical protein EZV73_13840 [Acidaminobacter sp. JC074]|uniref:metallophosphoesterase family protein n=1 Tax=Acidaminobacter sp. JC074 TaxID=2530199 RepID=UPI001F0F3A68|nr:metallophosphoesterase [Acidaminobacter sp. JC074]MCH4888670.1 hypothetical protein [Acidaminobacter sp. JC074]
MIRFLHIGDVHINKSFATKDEVLRHKLQRSVIKSFQNAVHYCITQDLDALMIAGDLFDGQHISLKDGEIVRDGFEQLNKAHIQVFYASGNHDYTHYDSKIRHMNYPENVKTFFDDHVDAYDLKDKSTGQIYKVVGCGHMIQHETRNLIENFPIGKHIGLCHSMVQSSLTIGDEGDYLPSTIETISSKGYLYFGLGHIHQNGPIDKHETIYYSGSLQGLHSNETGLKGGNLVTINDGSSHVQFVPLAQVLFDKLTVDISGLDHMEKLLDMLQNTLNDYEGDLENVSLELILTGRTKLYRKLSNPHEISDLRELLLDYHHLFDLKIRNKVKTHFDLEAYEKQNSVLGEVLRTIDNMEKLPSLDYLSDEELLMEIKDGLKDQVMDYFLEGYDED